MNTRHTLVIFIPLILTIGIIAAFERENQVSPAAFNEIQKGMRLESAVQRLGPYESVPSTLLMRHNQGPVVGGDADAYYVWRRRDTVFYVATRDNVIIYRHIENHSS